ncbi:hypothetical protein [Alistipes putredinis]|uniref:hypothetical protein n=1 Tax=Alistipes putredinis TaxID=28117 RepID=UPI0039930C93
MCRGEITRYPIPASHLSHQRSSASSCRPLFQWSPEVRIYHGEARRAGGYHVAFAYDAKTVLRRPLRQMWGLCYFDLWGRIGLSYDHERDVLTSRRDTATTTARRNKIPRM